MLEKRNYHTRIHTCSWILSRTFEVRSGCLHHPESSKHSKKLAFPEILSTLNPQALDRIRQFDKRPKEKVDDFGTYDYHSILHYEATAFAVDKSQPTIVPKLNQ